MCLIGVQDGRDVIFRMARGKQHARHGQHAGHALLLQLIQTSADDRCREFQKAIFDRQMRKAGLHGLGDLLKFRHGTNVAAAMATDHDTDLVVVNMGGNRKLGINGR